jgi:hypothetical protein
MQGGWIEDPAGMLVTMTGLVRRMGPGGRQEREKARGLPTDKKVE